MRKSTKEMNKESDFEKYSFIASKSTFEFISTDVQSFTSVTFQITKQFLEQTQTAGLNGTPLPPADKT